MGLTPTETLDPRDPWKRVRRMEVVRYAAELGIEGITEAMPKDVSVAILRGKGVPPPSVPPRSIGKNFESRSGTDLNSHHYNQPQQTKTQQVVEVDADELLMREWKAQQAPKMSITDARRACKDRKIPFARTDKLTDLMAKLNVQNTA